MSITQVNSKTKSTINLKQPLLLCCIGLISPLSIAIASDTTSTDKTIEGNKVHFSITESQRIENDIVSIRFKKQVQSSSAQAVTNEINQAMNKALKRLQKYPAISSQTSQYNIHPVHNKNRVISHWAGYQTLTIRFENSAKRLKSLADLQPILNYQSMNFSISEDRKQDALNSLTVKGIKRFQKKADLIATSFQAPNYKLLETRINMPNNSPIRHNYSAPRMMAAESMAPPAVEAGQSQLQVTITGSILISN